MVSKQPDTHIQMVFICSSERQSTFDSAQKHSNHCENFKIIWLFVNHYKTICILQCPHPYPQRYGHTLRSKIKMKPFSLSINTLRYKLVLMFTPYCLNAFSKLSQLSLIIWINWLREI